jgi:hypothetical protein
VIPISKPNLIIARDIGDLLVEGEIDEERYGSITSHFLIKDNVCEAWVMAKIKEIFGV